MPALVNSRVGSFAGISELEATRVCPFSSKKRRKASRISALFIYSIQANDGHGKSRQRAALYRPCAAGTARLRGKWIERPYWPVPGNKSLPGTGRLKA